jgi:choline-sulfatase
VPPDRPNVLLITSDQHSYRYVGHRSSDDGGEPAATPALDALAADATRFEGAYCPSPVCTPSRIATLTGKRASNCGAWGNGSRIDPDHRTVAEHFRDAGYRTCLVGKMHLGGDRQFVGFDHRPFGDLTGGAGHQHPDPPLDADRLDDVRRSMTADAGVTGLPETMLQERRVADETIAYLRDYAASDPDQPWFCCASLIRPHDPLTAPERHFERYWPDGVTDPKVGDGTDAARHPYAAALASQKRTDEIGPEEGRRARAAYFASVSYVDEVIGDLLSTLDRDGLLDDTIVVYTSDHGEMAGEHGMWWKYTWHEAAVRVPLLIQTPEQRSGTAPNRSVETPVSLVDLFPTLCGLADVSRPSGVDGADLSGAVETGSEPDRGPVLSEYFTTGDRGMFRMVRDGRHKYVGVRDRPELLFDLGDDPLERRDRSDDGACAEALDRCRAVCDAALPFDAVERRMDAAASAADDHRIDAPEPTTGNLYHLRDGRIVDADVAVYDPRTIVTDPERAFADWPGERD